MIRRVCLFLWLLSLLCFAPSGRSQSPALTTVKDTVYKSDGSLASGTVVISWDAFLDASNKAVLGGSKTITLTNGALAAMLVPNAGGTPSGTSYRVQYFEAAGRFAEERWVVPSSSPLSSPSAPTVTVVGTPGSTTYCYWITAKNAVGETLLSSGTCITNGNATLDTMNYNSVDWPDVAGATSYRVFRTSSSTAPTGTCPGGAHPACGVVGTPSASNINDQSSSTSSGTVPTVNDTDPRSLSQVRVLGVPSPAVVISPTQVIGTAVVQNPSGSQTITAASSASVPLAVKGKSGNNSNVFEVYDNAGTPALRAFFSAAGAADFGSAASFKAPTSAGASPTASGLLAYDSTSNTLEYGENGTNRTVVNTSRTLTGGAGIAAIGDLSADRTIATASGETDFLASGALTCGAGTQGRMQVHTTPLQYCSNEATPTLRYAAYGDSSGNAFSGDSATNFFSTGNLELARLPVGSANQILGTNAGATAQEHKTLSVGTAGTDFNISHAANSITFNLPDASATARGVVTTAAQTLAGPKTFTDEITTQKFLAGGLATAGFGTNMVFNAAAGNTIKLTLTGNVTSSSIANPTPGQFLTLLLCQDATGSRTMAWPTNLKLSGGSFTLTTTANKCDSLTAVYDGSNWYETARSTNL